MDLLDDTASIASDIADLAADTSEKAAEVLVEGATIAAASARRRTVGAVLAVLLVAGAVAGFLKKRHQSGDSSANEGDAEARQAA